MMISAKVANCGSVMESTRILSVSILEITPTYSNINHQTDKYNRFGRFHENGSTEQEKAGSLVGSAFQFSVSTCYDFDMKSSTPNR
jgi:hypothetical protein